MTRQVIVIGAGLAGLAAATKLKNAGEEVVVLEARDRVGGRTETGHLSDGQWMDLGGQWIGPGHERMYALVDELRLATFPLYDKGRLVLDLLGKRSTMRSGKGAIPRLGPFVLADLAQGMARFNRLASSVNVSEPWRTPRAKTLDGQTFRTWIDRNLRTAAGRAYFQIFTEAVFAAEPRDISALHALFYAESNADMETLMAVSDGAQQDKIDGGAALVSERLADPLAGQIHLSTPVRSVVHDGDGVRVIARDGREWVGSHVVVTLPPTLAGRLEYDPALPSWRDQLMQKLPAGSVIKLFAVYDRPFWREQGLNGQAGSDIGPVKVTFDNTPPGYGRGVMLGFMEADDGREWAQRTPDERKDAFVDRLVRYFGTQARHPVEYLERDWMDQEFSRGCYGAHFAPGVWTSYGHALREPVGKIHWAGAEYATKWNGYMEGAVRSGEQTAEEVLAALRP